MAVMAILAELGNGGEPIPTTARNVVLLPTFLFLGYIADTGILSLIYALCTSIAHFYIKYSM
jgi:hypothetical protein